MYLGLSPVPSLKVPLRFLLESEKPLSSEQQGQGTAASLHGGTDKFTFYKSVVKWFLSMAKLYYT